MKGAFNKIMDNSAVLAFVAIVLAAGVMAAMFLVFENVFDDPRPGSEVVSEFAEGAEGLADGEIFSIPIRSIPAPFVSPDDGSVLGYVFLDVTLEVAGQEARAAALAALEDLKTDFTEMVAGEGVGTSSRPGVVDYDRLARIFMELAQAKVGPEGVARVVIQASIVEE